MSQQESRPGHATLAGVLIIVGSIVLVLSAWERIAGLHTLEVQEELGRIIADRPLSEAGITVDGLAMLVRVLCLVGAGAAAAATILGFQVFKRSLSARIVLTALSPLLLVGGMATAGFLAPMVVAGIVLLWLQPTRDWYAGRPWRERYEARRAERLARTRPAGAEPRGDAAGTGRPNPFAPPAPPAPPVSQPAPSDPRPQHAAQPVPAAPGYGPPAATHRRDVVRGPRPPALVFACVLTWVASGTVLAGLALLAAVLPSQSEELYDELVAQQPNLAETYQLTEASLLGGMYAMVAGLALWAVVAAVLAGLTFTGRNWARITLAVSAVCAGCLCLLMALGAWPLVMLVAVLAVSTWLLLRADVGAWFSPRP